MFLSECKKIIPIAKELDISSTVNTDSIYCRDLVGNVCFVFSLNTLGGASSVLTIASGISDAALTTNIRFNYAFGGAAIGTAVAGSASSCDVLAALTSATSLTLTYGTYSNFMLVVEVDVADMNSSLDHDWLTCTFTDPGSATGTVTGFAIAGYRHPAQGTPTVLAI